ncbi:MAG: 3-keto-5-aminohexanoate cleavage protein [Deltaproteobacteria bacterium]|nr:3-keto-5-aminohexanoate cleavage protein [Deltaproteobacteria bacterium]
MEKTIITASVTGSLVTREQNPNIPYTPEEIARATIESYKAGAAVAHLHVRDPLTGKPVQDIELFKETIRLIRKDCDIVINTSTGGGPGMTYEERISIIPALSADENVKPEMASLNAGSLNFGILSRKKREFLLDAVQQNPWSELLKFADTMTMNGVKAEIEIYEAGMIHNAKVLHELGALNKPLHFQFVLGVLGGMQATVDNLVFLKNSIPPASTWSVCAVGLDIFPLGAAAIAAGGHVRVGLEDSVHIAKGELAQSNDQLVDKIAEISRSLGREVANAEEARIILNI